MHSECLQNTGQTVADGTTCEPFRRRPLTTGRATSSLVAIPAKQTLPLENQQQRVLAVSSSALLMNFARDLFSERIRATFARMLPGLGGDSEAAWSRLVTLSCPSDCERVALALSTDGKGCFCSPSLPTPTATDWKGGHDRHPEWRQWNLRDWWRKHTGRRYLPIEVSTAVQGFPATWTDLDASETP